MGDIMKRNRTTNTTSKAKNNTSMKNAKNTTSKSNNTTSKNNNNSTSGNNNSSNNSDVGFDVESRRSFRLDEDNDHSFELRDS